MIWNVIRFFKDYNIPYKTEGPNCAEGWVNICCPSCSKGDSSYHLGFNLKNSYFHCWREGGISIVRIITLLLLVDPNTASKIMNSYIGEISILENLNKKKAKAKTIKLPGSPLSKYHKQYLKSRNFDPDFLIQKYKILGTGPKETFFHKNYELRIIIPIINNKGKIVSFQGRDITGKAKLKYKAAPIELSLINPKDILYNLNNCIEDKICIVEGVFDVWRMGDNFAASFGTSLTDNQIKCLLSYKQIFWLFDPESEAQEKAKKAAVKLASLNKEVELIELKMDRDPAELTSKEVKEIRRELGV